MVLKTLLGALLLTGIFEICVAADPNAVILKVIGEMPKGGGYSVENKAKRSLDALRGAVKAEAGKIVVNPETAQPSFCSSATYIVLLRAVDRIRQEEKFAVSAKAAALLNVREEQPDGEGVWGRWNANGPGAAKLMHDTGMGRNFDDWKLARRGDFMKIFWTEEVGQKEHGHLVVYLGTRRKGGQEMVRFWSSNKPGGYGEKEVPREKIRWAIFSRLEHPERINAVTRLSGTDRFLSDMLTKRFSREQVLRKLGVGG